MSKHSILLVDDNPTSLKLLRAIYEGDYDTSTASDGLEALDVLLQNKIDLVITDVLMPNMDGYHLCYRIRTNPKLKDIPVVIYTATYVSLSEAKIAMDMGASYYIRKPASSQVLVSTAKEILAHPEAFPHKIPTRPESAEMMQQYSAKLIDKLEQSNIDLEAAKNKIEQSEKYFRALVENEYSITVVMNEKLQVIYRSQSSETILGWSMEERERLGPEEITHPGDREYQRRLMKQSFDNPGKIIRLVLRAKHKNGNYLWLEGTSVNLLADPNVRGIITNLHDVTEMKEAEQKLAASEQRFRSLIENSSDAIVLNDVHSNLEYQSPSVTRILGYSIGERKGKRSLDYVHPEDKENSAALYKNSAANPGVPIPFQHRFRHRDGHYVWLEGVLTNLSQDPSVKAYVANYRDVTGRKEAEQTLARTLRRFEQAQQIAHLGNWEVDFVTQKITWSDEAFRIYGIEPHSIGPSEDLFLQHVHPDDLEMVKAATEHGQQTLTPFSFYHRIVQPSGKVRKLFAVGQFEFDTSNRPVALYGISLDITELAEKEIKLEQANKELATFIYKAYHDLRSPIVSMLGTVDLAHHDVKDQQALEYFDMISQIAQKQNKMLLSLIKVMSIRERDLIIAPVEMDKLVGEVMDFLKTVEGFDISQFKINNGVRKPALTDRDLVFDMLSNLADNSIHYRDPARQVEIKITTDLDKEGNLVLEVADNGIGIAESVKDKVFDMFYRGTVVSKGTGLGLFVVKNAVEKLGGTIELSGSEKVGATFRINLPPLEET